ncbi:hypothetical protein Tco_0256557, partial [Tanacetum coccineum]
MRFRSLDNKLNLIPTEINDDGAEVVIFDEEIVKEGSKKWELTVCGHFVGYKMSYQEISLSKLKVSNLFCYVSLLHTKDEALDKLKVFKTEVKLHQRSLIKRFRTDRVGLSQGLWGEAMEVVRLPDPKLKTLGERGIKCIFVGYAEYSKAFRFYVIEPNDSVLINSIIESRDAIFDENRLSSVPRPSQRSLVNGTEDIGCLVVLEEVTKE